MFINKKNQPSNNSFSSAFSIYLFKEIPFFFAFGLTSKIITAYHDKVIREWFMNGVSITYQFGTFFVNSAQTHCQIKHGTIQSYYRKNEDF